jgi:predicted acyl esterase
VCVSFNVFCFLYRSSNDDEGRSAGQFWTTMDKFPAAVMTPYYLNGDGTATLEAPQSDSTPSTSFVYDPTDIIATQGGNNLFSDAPCGM